MTRHARRWQRNDAMPRWGRGLLILVLLLAVAPGGARALARDGAATLDEAVEQAVRTAAGRRVSGAVHVVEAIGRGGWSFGTAALQGTEGADAPPEVVYYLARQSNGRWAAVPESAPAFRQWAQEAPAEVVPAVFLPASANQVSAQATRWWHSRMELPLAFPFPIGSAWYMLGGPHGHNQADANQHPWAALDFNSDRSGSASGGVVAAAPGFATTPCAVGEDLGPLVNIRHENGWETEYFHLANVPPSVSGNISRGARLGDTSTNTTGGSCYGSASATHLHFAVQQVKKGKTTKAELNGVSIGGYKIAQGSEAYRGCLRKMGDPSADRCVGDPILNTGELNSGAYVKTNKTLVSGRRVSLELGKFPSEESFAVTIVYAPYGGTPSALQTLKTVRTGVNGNASFSFIAPKVRMSGKALICADGNEVDLRKCREVRTLPRSRR